MKIALKSSLFALFVVSLIILGTYIVQADEVEVLPTEPIIEVAEIIPPLPELLETESEPIPNENLTDLGTSTADALPVSEATEPIASIEETVLPPVAEVGEEVVPEKSEILVPKQTPLPPHPEIPNFPEEILVERLPTIIQDCLGGHFRDFSRPFAHPGECLAYVRSL